MHARPVPFDSRPAYLAHLHEQFPYKSIVTQVHPFHLQATAPILCAHLLPATSPNPASRTLLLQASIGPSFVYLPHSCLHHPLEPHLATSKASFKHGKMLARMQPLPTRPSQLVAAWRINASGPIKGHVNICVRGWQSCR